MEEKRRDLTQVRLRALSVLAGACLREGDAAEAVTWAEQMTALEPFRESGYRRLMEAHVAAGNRAEALRVYERCRRLLADELGTYPSPETESIYRSLLEAPPGPREAPSAGERRARLRLPRENELGITWTPAGCSAPRGVACRRGRRGRARNQESRSALTAERCAEQCRPDRSTHAEGDTGRAGSRCPRSCRRLGRLRLDHEPHPPRHRPGHTPNAGDRALTRVDPSSGKAVVVGGGLAPCGLTADPSGDIWVANCYPGTSGPRDDVVRIDARTLHFKKTFPLSGVKASSEV